MCKDCKEKLYRVKRWEEQRKLATLRYWDRMLRKLEDALCDAQFKLVAMHVFNKRFEGDPRIANLMPIYNRQAALVKMLTEQADVAWAAFKEADSDLEVVSSHVVAAAAALQAM